MQDDDRKGNVVARFTFRGRFQGDSFPAFAQHRAARLSLQLQLGACDATVATMSVTGQEALVDAFEIACSLGPYDCIVLDVERFPPA
jgi:hypothetical protein